MPAIETEALSKFYGAERGIEDVTLTVERERYSLALAALGAVLFDRCGRAGSTASGRP